VPLCGATPEECGAQFRDHLAAVFARIFGGQTPHVKSLTLDAGRTVVGFWSIQNRGGVKVPTITPRKIKTQFGPLLFSFSQDVRAVECEEHDDLRLETVGYGYRLSTSSSKPIMRWEYERWPPPGERPKNLHPRHHVQVHTDVSVDEVTMSLKELHPPTGWVLIEEVLRFLIEDCKMEHQAGDGWHELLVASEDKFHEQFSKRERPTRSA
jgi:hypothetical protein